MDATLRISSSDTRGVVIAVLVAIAGLAIVLMSAGFGQWAADEALRAAGGSMATSRYELMFQLNADAARFAGAVLLGVGAFMGLRRV